MSAQDARSLDGKDAGWSIALGAATAALLVAAPLAVRAEEAGGALRRAFFDEASLTVHLRSYYMDRTNARPPDNVAWAGGGWVGYETGWLFDAVRFGVVGYTSQPLVAPRGTDSTNLLGSDQFGYTVLGQAWGKLRLWGQEFTGYRQLIDQPEVNPQDNRMTPNTFEAYTLAGRLSGVRYLAGYVDRIKRRNAVDFVDMATAAGAPAGSREGMLLAGLSYVPDDDFTARLSGYLVPNVLASGYGDFAKTVSLTDSVDLRIGGQLMIQGSTGTNLLAARPYSTWSGGLDLDLTWGPVMLTMTYTQTGSAAAYRTPYGTWAGYTSMIVRDFNRANEGAFLLGTRLDMAMIGAPGFAFTANAVFGNGAIDAATGAALSTNNEYDFTLDYLFANSAHDWPAWLKPVWIRARAGLLDQYLGGSYTTVRDYRVILNYEWKFGGR
jgi:hypothetical protein